MPLLGPAPSDMHTQGKFLQADFFDNAGGLNLSDSPFRVKDNQHILGYNVDLSFTGAFGKRNGHTRLNASPDAQLKSWAINTHTTASGTKTVVRCAGTKLQTVNTSTWACSNVAEDTVSAGTTFFNTASTTPVQLIQFNTAAANVLWAAGAGASAIYGYTGTNVTKNGADVATGSFTATRVALGSGVWAGTGTYFYAIALRKLGTQQISNAGLDTSATVTVVTDKVTLDFSSLTSLDTTKYDKIYIYRSSVGGASAFTTGDLVAIVNSSTTTYDDTGAYTATSQNVPRAGNTNLDNSVLPSGTYTSLTSFKRRLVTATGSTLYLSDLNKPEAWPTTNTITVPSGGPITAVASIYYASPSTAATDELLVVFKERECWVVTGSNSSDWSLKFVDAVGCLSQPSLVWANTFLCWPDYRGFYIWDGTEKPIYISRPMEFQFSLQGTLDRSKLGQCVGTFFRKDGHVIWVVSDSQLGDQKYQIKLDLRLTLPQVESTAQGRFMDGCFTQDSTGFALYAAASCLPTYDEVVLAGDDAGYLYSLYDNIAGDPDNTWPFSYRTRPLDLGSMLTTKRIQKVIVWVKETTTDSLTLNYWMTYRTTGSLQQTRTQPVATTVSSAIWDQGYWDQAFWDVSPSTYNPVVFNFPEGAEGEALTLEFVQNTYGAQIVICGFSVIYSVSGLRL